MQRDIGDLKGALDSLQKAANMQSNLLGDHEDTACSNSLLSLVQRDIGDLKEFWTLYKEQQTSDQVCLEITKPRHPATTILA